MDLKQEVLKVLERNRGSSVSGAMLADELKVTRSAIWKAIKSLKQDGYHIDAVTNKGYCLLWDNDIVSAESIQPYLKGKACDFLLDVRQCVTSTNTIAKELASKGAKEGTVIIAREQTAGRGRMGRSFYSPNSSGIYLSIILRPKLGIQDSLRITTTTAVAVAKAIETVAGVDAHIKWVNDIYLHGRKVCGILSEASLNFENGCLEYAVVGIGINVSTKDFPDPIRSIAGSIFDEKPSSTPITSVLTATILNNIAEYMDSLADIRYLEEYRRRSFLIGKDILVIKGENTLPARAVEIDDEARLVVEYQDHTREALSSGEVSTKAVI